MKYKKLKLIFELLDIWSNLAPMSDSKTQQNLMPVTVLNVSWAKTLSHAGVKAFDNVVEWGRQEQDHLGVTGNSRV